MRKGISVSIRLNRDRTNENHNQNITTEITTYKNNEVEDKRAIFQKFHSTLKNTHVISNYRLL